jgi:pepF/M3 family oligoendopeptidase
MEDSIKNSIKDKLPRWSLKSIYPSFKSQEYKTDMALLKERIASFEKLLKKQESQEFSEKSLFVLIKAFETAADTANNLGAYTEVIYTTNTKSKEAVAEINNIDSLSLPLSKNTVRFRALLLKNKSAILKIVKKSTLLKDYNLFITESIEKAKYQMSTEMEDLASDLAMSGADAWARLHSAISSTISAVWDTKTSEKKTLTALRDLAHNSDREIRKRAYEAEINLLKENEIALAASLNGVKGAAISLDKRRLWESVVKKSCFQSRISEAALSALISTLEKSLPLFRRYLTAKAKILGIEKCAFYDIFAPVQNGGESKKWSWKEACNFIVERFNEFDPVMADFAKEAYSKSWVDAEGRDGKIGGAYCEDFPLAKESRILCNFDGSFDSLVTVAHESGHAFHHRIVKDLPRFQSLYPMTLAETASIFAETIVFEGALKTADNSEKLSLIEGNIADCCQVIVDILCRFYFEKELFEKREKGEVPPEELCAMMLDAQNKTYGKSLGVKHQYMWAVKVHYYNYNLPFYNYPYAFGQLFSLALYANAKKEGSSFAKTYRNLLLETGRLSSVELTRKAGFDIEKEAFWQNGIKIIAGRIKQFEDMIEKSMPRT